MAVGKVEQRAAVSLGRVFSEYLVEASAAGEQVKAVVEDQKRLGKRIHDRQRQGLSLCPIVELFHWIMLR